MNVGLTPHVLVGQVKTKGGLSSFAPLFRSSKMPAADPAPRLLPASAAQAALSPEELAARSKAGCLDSFEELVKRHERHIFNFLRQFTGNHHDAEDLTQETFVKAYRNLHRYKPSLPFAPWLFTIARRTGASHFRSAPVCKEPPLEEESLQQTPATTLECKDDRNSVWKLVRTLKPKQAEALWLRYAEGFSVAETAQIMRTNQIHVKVLLHRARSNLSKILTLHGWFPERRTALQVESKPTGNR